MRTLVINTGGTIGMAQTSAGFAPRDGVIEAAVEDLMAAGRIASEVQIENLTPLIDGAQATPDNWNTIVQTVARSYADFDGFVVIHGTDTLAYTAAALCLGLCGTAKPVIVTGAMLPLTVDGSDGARNLADAVSAASSAPAGVWVQFAGNLLHAGRVRKSHSAALDAFEAAPSAVAPLIPAQVFSPRSVTPHKVGVFTVAPGTVTDMLDFAVDHCDGLVLRCYGSGTAPDTPGMHAALARAHKRHVPVIAVSQCPEGGIELGTYAAGSVMRSNGVIDGRDITPEMAYVKLHTALSLGGDFDAQRAFLATAQCGELTEPA